MSGVVIIPLIDRIEKWLIEAPHLRDSDNKLISTIWWQDIKGTNNIDQMSAMDFLTAFSNGDLTNPESIRRCRQKLQQENKELRGRLWKERHEKQDEVRDQLGYNTDIGKEHL